MNPYHHLCLEEKEALLKFPALVSLLAVSRDDKLDEEEIKSAFRFSHIKTYCCHPLLVDFFKYADRTFTRNIEKLDQVLPKERHQREAAIQSEFEELEQIVWKLEGQYASVMFHSMQSFKDHVSKAHHNVLVDFIFPCP